MTWPINPALDALNDASLTYANIHGVDAMLRWLQNEASRLRMTRDVFTKRRADAGVVVVEAAAEIDAEHEATLRVLERYADPGFYRETKRKPVSEVMADGGAMARARLDEIEALFGEDGK